MRTRTVTTSPPSNCDERASRSGVIAENDTLISGRGHRIAYRRRGTGPTVLLLHGFPTWSYDYAELASDLATDHDVITMDFLGYGASDKPSSYTYSVAESADTVEDLVAHLGLTSVRLVVHDYGGIVGQELLDRANRGRLPFAVDDVTMLNCGIVYSAYRPTRTQKLLILPVLGKLIAGRVSAARVRSALDAVRGTPLSDHEFDDLWLGMSKDDGHRLSHLLIRYNAERAIHHQRWESALADWARCRIAMAPAAISAVISVMPDTWSVRERATQQQ